MSETNPPETKTRKKPRTKRQIAGRKKFKRTMALKRAAKRKAVPVLDEVPISPPASGQKRKYTKRRDLDPLVVEALGLLQVAIRLLNRSMGL